MQTQWIYQKSGFKGCVKSLLFPVQGILVTDAIKENGFCFIMRIETLSKILGHTSIKTTLDEYGTEDLEDVQENYKKIMQEMF